MDPIKAYGYYFTEAIQPLEKKEFTIDSIPDDYMVVKVARCGLCHTDLYFIAGGVRTNHELPLILGHEISGEVIASGSVYNNMVGEKVIIPSTLPCGECVLCKNGRANVCSNKKCWEMILMWVVLPAISVRVVLYVFYLMIWEILVYISYQS